MGSGMADEDIFALIYNNPALYQYQSCNSAYWDRSMYLESSATMSAFMDVLLCLKVHISELGLKVYVKNCEDTGPIDECVLYPEKSCKGTHLQLNNGQSERICGRDTIFKDMNENQLVEMEEYTGDMTKHAFRVCPNDSGHQGNIFWRGFIKVLRNNEDAEYNEGDNGEYEVISGVKNQMELLPVSESVKKFFVQLLDVLDTYFSHSYEIKLSHRVKKRE